MVNSHRLCFLVSLWLIKSVDFNTDFLDQLFVIAITKPIAINFCEKNRFLVFAVFSRNGHEDVIFLRFYDVNTGFAVVLKSNNEVHWKSFVLKLSTYRCI